MNVDFWSGFLLYSLAVNYFILMLWFVLFVFARNWVKQVHGKWFQLSDISFDAIHYGGMALYKIGIFLFNLAPLLALYFIGKN